MEKLVITPILLLSITSVFAQNNVTITQTGGASNSASVTQSGEGNSVSISQTGGAVADGSKPGNRVSLQVPQGTETTISQRNTGPNVVEISQEGKATATISQSSETGENFINSLPASSPNRPKNKPVKRQNRRKN
ncbi:curlin repeat-containing protein [Spirosoma oryzicola]|uniref:curlin repeat-containing protein n=1 Tax=Spirosoma oryzicola TaxID=2898794 RepID=UPI001E5376C0|nr:curlin repeat-containing protein [Spirosoma oryzicola]UHG94803.1 curlin repeat-containing protein [Spirosoma oryzicola]